MILIEASNNVMLQRIPKRLLDDYTNGRFCHPVRHLFVLQRINRDFRFTINQSKTLQQRMFLVDGPHVSAYSPLVWLSVNLEDHAHYNFGFQKPPEAAIFDFKLIINPYSFSEEMDISGPEHPWLRREASWRKMKAFDTKTLTAEFSETSDLITCRIGSSFCGGSAYKLGQIKAMDDFTLGRFDDWFAKLVEYQLRFYAAGHEARCKRIPELELQGPVMEEINGLKF